MTHNATVDKLYTKMHKLSVSDQKKTQTYKLDMEGGGESI
jgi:hypothetical protein